MQFCGDRAHHTHSKRIHPPHASLTGDLLRDLLGVLGVVLTPVVVGFGICTSAQAQDIPPANVTPANVTPANITPANITPVNITPAPDGVGTQVNWVDDRYDISGGTTSGGNLFHSFDQFGVATGETANFIANPHISNILGRVTGGDASYVNGLLQVTNSHANLFLMNPAGIVFGENARLNVLGDFTATTATAIGFDGGFFNAVGTSDYDLLVGSPNRFAFSELATTATVLNQGELAVNPGQTLMLLGGTTINTGSLTAPGGQVVVASVPTQSIPTQQMVRLSQQGMVLGLEFAAEEVASTIDPNLLAATFNPLTLPNLLTGGHAQNATDLTIRSDGTVALSGSGLVVPPEPGTTLVSGSVSTRSPAGGGGTIDLLGQKVAVVDATIDASGVSGGTIHIGGDYQGHGTIPNATQTFVNTGTTIHADGLSSPTNLQLQTPSSNGGRVIVWADDTTGFYGTITAQGGITGGDGGFVEVSGAHNLVFQGWVDTSAPQGTTGTLLLDPTNIDIVSGSGFSGSSTSLGSPVGTGDTIWSTGEDLGDQTIGADTINLLLGVNDLTLQASNDINVNSSITYTGGLTRTLTLEADNNLQVAGNVTISSTAAPLNLNLHGNADGSGGGSVVIGDNVTPTAIHTNGGDLSILGEGESSSAFGINVANATLDAGGGNITLIGTGSSSSPTNRGIVLRGNPTIETSGSGSITLTGSADATGSVDFSHGILIEDTGAAIKTEDGNINLTGTGQGTGTNNIGIEINQGTISSTGTGSITITGTGASGTNNNYGVEIDLSSSLQTNSGDLTITGTGGEGTGTNNYGIHLSGNNSLSSGGNLTLTGVALNDVDIQMTGSAASSLSAAATLSINGTFDLGSFDVTLTADDIDFTNVISGTGNLTLQPFSTSRNVFLGGTPFLTALFLSNTELSNLQNGFSSITIGRSDGDGRIDFGSNLTFNDPLILRMPNGFGSINTSGGSQIAQEGVSLETGQTLTLGNWVVNGNDLQATSNSGRVVIDGTLSNTGTGNITLQGNNTGLVMSPSIEVNSSIATNGGAITLTGITSTTAQGVYVQADISSNGGTVDIIGNSTGDTGIWLTTGGSINTGGGDVNLNGTTSGSGGFWGVLIDELSGGVDTGGGDLTLIGHASSSADTGIEVRQNLYSGTGLMQLQGDFSVLIGSSTTPVTLTSGDLTLQANDSLVLDSTTLNSTAATSLGGSVLLNSDLDSDGQGAISLTNSFVTIVNGGDIILGGGSNPLTQFARGDSFFGIEQAVKLFGSILDAVGGNISIRGQASNSATNADGVALLSGSTVTTTGTGTITIDGISGLSAVSLNSGIQVDSSTISAVDGSVTLTGTGRGVGSDSIGVLVGAGGWVETTGSGNVNVTGASITTTFPSNFEDGIRIDGGTVETTSSGNITLVGTGGNSSGGLGHSGIEITNGGTVQADGAGNIDLRGTGGNGNNNNEGILVSGSTSKVQVHTGSLTLNGTGRGTGTDNHGVVIDNALVTSIGTGSVGSITLTGTGTTSGGVPADGVLVFNSGSVTAVDASVTLAGTGTIGSKLYNSALVQTTGTGDIALAGTSTNGSDDILVDGSQIDASGNGSITLTANQIGFQSSVPEPVTVTGNGSNTVQLESTTSGSNLQVNFGTNANPFQNSTSSTTGFSNIFIGRSSNSGTVTLAGTAIFSDPVIIQAGSSSGAIDTTTATLVGEDNATITLTANQNINTADITNPDRAITLTSTEIGGQIDTTSGTLDTRGTTSGGNIMLSADGSVSVGNLRADSDISGSGGGGTVSVTSISSVVTAASGALITATAQLGTGGNITLQGATGLDLFAQEIDATASSGSGGQVNLEAGLSTGLISINGTDLKAGTTTVTADAVDLNGGVGSTLGTGTLFIQPLTSTQAIQLGDPETTISVPTLILNSTDLNALGGGFSAMTIGRTNGTGTVTLGTGIALSDPTNIQGTTAGYQLQGSSTGTTFTLTGATAGQITNGGISFSDDGSLSFSNVATLVAGSGSDTINTPTGVNTTVVLAGNNAGSVLGINFSGIENLNGQGASDTLQGTTGNDAFILTGSNQQTILGMSFIGIENLNGGAGDDMFTLNGGTLSGSIDGGNDTDQLNYSSVSSPVAVNLSTNTATAVGGSISNFEQIQGGSSSSDSFTATTGNDTLTMTTTGGDLNGVLTFNGFEIIDAGAGTDAVNFTTNDTIQLATTDKAFSLLGSNFSEIETVTAGGSSNVLLGNSLGQTFTATAPNQVNVAGIDFTGLEELEAGAGNDVFNLNGGSLTNVLGGAGADTFNLNGGNVTGNLMGEAGNDAVNVNSTSGVTGAIDGGNDTDQLNYSSVSSPVAVNLSTNTATAVGGSISNFEQIQGGSSSSDSFTATTGNDTLTMTTTGGDLNGVLTFNGFEIIDAGAGDDTISLGTGVSLGAIDGNTGNNTLQAPPGNVQFTTANGGLQANTIFSNLQNLTLSSGSGGGSDVTIVFDPGSSLSGNLLTSNNRVTLTGNEIDIGGSVSGTGSLTIQPVSSTQAIHLGGSSNSLSSVLELTATELSNLQNGFSQIQIISPSGNLTGEGTVSFQDPLVLQAVSGAIDLTPSTLIGLDNASLTLEAGQTLSTGDLISNGNAISLTAPGAIVTSTLNSSNSSGGNITVKSGTTITTGILNSSGTLLNGGNVLLDPPGDVQVTAINAQGGASGVGGNVEITTDSLFRATGSFVDRNNLLASISTAGGLGGGAITIRHGGGDVTLFTVGIAEQDLLNGLQNGTIAAITTGTFTIPTNSYTTTFSVTTAGLLSQTVNIGTAPNINVITSGVTRSLVDLEDEGGCPPTCNLSSDNRVVTGLVNLNQTFLSSTIEQIEGKFTDEVSGYVGRDQQTTIRTLDEIRQDLRTVERATGIKPALIYATFQPTTVASSAVVAASQTASPGTVQRQPTDELELLLVTGNGNPIRYRVAGATRDRVDRIVQLFQQEVNDTSNTGSKIYLNYAQRLYNWMIKPLVADLGEKQIDNLLFAMDSGLRSLPLAALHDGEQFLIENYSVGVMPSLSLTDTRYRDIRNTRMVAMGASNFADQNPLPTVPVEINTLVGEQGLWQGRSFLNEDFNLTHLQQHSQGYGIVHLATHADFVQGNVEESYIQLFDERLSMSNLRQFNWQTGNGDAPVELLTLSACRTAIGSEEAELGFAGLAIQAGVKSALASLWYVSDAATAGLMTRFYSELQSAPIKAEALRRAQLALARGEVSIEGTALRGVRGGDRPIDLQLPPEALKFLTGNDLSHPYYWAAFTLVGSPW